MMPEVQVRRWLLSTSADSESMSDDAPAAAASPPTVCLSMNAALEAAGHLRLRRRCSDTCQPLSLRYSVWSYSRTVGCVSPNFSSVDPIPRWLTVANHWRYYAVQ